MIWGKVNGPYLDAFSCLLPYSTRIIDIEISVRLQMYGKKPESIPEFWN